MPKPKSSSKSSNKPANQTLGGEAAQSTTAQPTTQQSANTPARSTAQPATQSSASTQLSRKQFDVLNALYKQPGASLRAIVASTDLSLGTVSQLCNDFKAQGFIYAERNQLTPAAFAALEPFRVKNAILMAAGMSSRFAPISYERPKGVLRVRGEVLVERQIRQLQEAGITDITIVVGYKKEEFFYLEDAFGVKIVINDAYSKRNNNSTLYLVREQLDNTYICSSDNYFTENPFETYVYSAYYAGVFFEGPSSEYLFKTKGKDKLIVGCEFNGADAWGMLGHAYFDRVFSKRFVEFLLQDYDLPETAGKLWEDVYLDHVADLPMVVRQYPDGVIYEFDNLEELRAFDDTFIENVDCNAFDNICQVLGCTRAQVSDFVPIKQGLTNLSCRFVVEGKPYVYRYPGAGTSAIINRESEVFSQEVARDLGIDETFIFEDPETGVKISRFVEGARELDYHDEVQVKTALSMARKLHESGAESPWSFDVYQKAADIVALLQPASKTGFRDFDFISSLAATLYEYVCLDQQPKCLCHNDFYAPNFLVNEEGMQLIDWEYSAMSDYASDLGTFICCSDYTLEEAQHVIDLYFDRSATKEEMRHCLAYTGISSYYWFVWALYKESQGESVGEWLYLWYKGIKRFGAFALNLYVN